MFYDSGQRGLGTNLIQITAGTVTWQEKRNLGSPIMDMKCGMWNVGSEIPLTAYGLLLTIHDLNGFNDLNDLTNNSWLLTTDSWIL